MPRHFLNSRETLSKGTHCGVYFNPHQQPLSSVGPLFCPHHCGSATVQEAYPSGLPPSCYLSCLAMRYRVVYFGHSNSKYPQAFD